MCVVMRMLVQAGVMAALTAAPAVAQTSATPWLGVRQAHTEGRQKAVAELRGNQVPTRVECREVSFDSTGADEIAESSFVLVVTLEIDRAGLVQRFRVDRHPPIDHDFAAALGVALVDWRYAVPPSAHGDTFRFPVALQKPRGATITRACQADAPDQHMDSNTAALEVALATYIQVLADAAERTTYAPDRPRFQSHLAQAAGMFAALRVTGHCRR